MTCEVCEAPLVRRWRRCPTCGAVPLEPEPESDPEDEPAPEPLGPPRAPPARIPVGPLDAPLGGGLAEGFVAVLSGAPGAGKTSLVLRALAAAGGELLALESPPDLAREYAARLALDVSRIRVVEDPRLARSLAACRGPLVALDSMALAQARAESRGSVARQVAALAALQRWARERPGRAAIAIALAAAGEERPAPLAIGYLADAVIWLDRSGIRVDKHRAGPAGFWPWPAAEHA